VKKKVAELDVVEVGAGVTEKTAMVLGEEAQTAGRERPCSRDFDRC
jgi:hypothetical protein